MAKIFIFEGIASSGKTSTEIEFCNILAKKGLGFSLIKENQTLMPILDNKKPQIAVEFLEKVLDAVLADAGNKILIFDRLYFTHILRTGSSIREFKKIENRIKEYDPLVVFLKIPTPVMIGRLEWAMANRDDEWRNYVAKKGTKSEIFEYYAKQQGELWKLVDSSNLPTAVYDTAGLDFGNIARKLFDKYC